MAVKNKLDINDYIYPLNMNGLRGRMLRLPPPKGKKREILYVYGHHSSIERWWGLAQELNRYAGVTVPDLPGFGGMDSFYKIGRKPTVDTLADYLATFIKLRYKRRRVTVMGLSFGFVVVTRMLQRYPDLAKKIDLTVSVVGFSHKDDFAFTKPRYWALRSGAAFFSLWLPSKLLRYTLLNSLILRTFYGRLEFAQDKFANLSNEERKRMLDFEVHLWHANDIRTHCYTANQFFKIDNCQQQVDVPLWHIWVPADRYFDHHRVEQHLQIIFKEFKQTKSRMSGHAPTIIAEAEEAAPLIPPALRRWLNKD